jgi:hypothetical protein
MESKYIRDKDSFKPLCEIKKNETNYSVKNLQSINTKWDNPQKKQQ